MKAFFFLPKGTMNEATEYYTNLLVNAFGDYEVFRSDIPYVEDDVDVIVTIRSSDQNKLKYKNRKKSYYYVNWFQGIGPEEYELLHNYTLKAKIGKVYLSFFEKRALKRTDLCLFVSQEMVLFYEKKYNLNLKNKALIIPCYNKPLDDSAFLVENKYKNLSFVYAGALHGWQCIEESLLVYKNVFDYDQTANLTLLTGQKEQAEGLIQKYDLKNVSVKFVKLEQLQDELKKYKYGFLLRKDDPINNVATPTKMNSYLAAGIIPIYSNVIIDFKVNLNLGEYALESNLEKNSLEEIAYKIRVFDHKIIEPELIRNVFQENFKNYYSDNKYVLMLQQKLVNFNKNEQ